MQLDEIARNLEGPLPRVDPLAVFVRLDEGDEAKDFEVGGHRAARLHSSRPALPMHLHRPLALDTGRQRVALDDGEDVSLRTLDLQVVFTRVAPAANPVEDECPAARPTVVSDRPARGSVRTVRLRRAGESRPPAPPDAAG